MGQFVGWNSGASLKKKDLRVIRQKESLEAADE
jgi:hypothetical protein